MTRERAWQLVCEYVASESLRRHMLAVEAAMRHYARLLGGDEEQWAIAGLLHDFDYERWPDPPEHTREGEKILRANDVDEEIIGAIMAHAEWNHDRYPPDRPIRKALLAVDELCGFIVAAALVRPTRLEGMDPSSIRRKMKTPSFAANVKREDIVRGAELLALPLDEHITNCIVALRGIASALGLAN